LININYFVKAIIPKHEIFTIRLLYYL
jgi:hypothetical protein